MYYPDDKEFAIYNGKLTDTLSCASEFEFNMPAHNKLYDSLAERISMVQILRDNDEVFYGEVREIKETLEKTKEVYCVGELAFLFDSTQPQARYQDIAPEQFLIELLNIHNSKVEEKKRFYPGIVTVHNPNNSLYRYTNGEDTLTAIRKKLCEPLGGNLRIRKVDGKRYLDLVPLEEYGVSAEQPIQFGRNLLKYNSKRSGANIATVCVPRGAKLDTQAIEGLDAYVDIKSVNDGKDYVINQAAYETYGWIEKIVEWKNVTEPQNLLKKAQEWVNNNQYRILSLDLKAVDLAELNANLSPYKVGDMIHAIAEPFGMDMWFPLQKKVTYINDSITNDVTLSYQAKMTYTSQQNNNLQDIGNAIPQETALLERARINATEMLNLATRGNIYYVYDEDGRPIEQLIMDTNDINTAQKVWRWNANGFGYSKNGYKGPYELAMTMDGSIVADMITSGILNANLLKVGIIKSLDGKSYWNLETGELVMNSYATTESVTEQVNNLQQQIDGAVETFTGDEVPTLENVPASEWTTDEIKDSHISDLYIVSSDGGDYAGFYYRFEKINGVYQWTLLKDTEITKALQDAAEANAKADALAENLATNYSTTTQMNSAIKTSADSITSTVSKQITETKSYAEEVSSAAENNANKSTDTKLKNYATTQTVSNVKADGRNYVLKSAEEKQLGPHVSYDLSPSRKNMNGEKLVLTVWLNVPRRPVEQFDITFTIGNRKMTYPFSPAQFFQSGYIRTSFSIPSAVFDNNGTLDIEYSAYSTQPCYIKNVKLEIGDTRTDWTYAPEDFPEKFTEYSTTSQMNSAIDQKANQITLSVDNKITETKTYAESVANSAESNANASMDEKLLEYSTTTEMHSAIDMKSDSIMLEVRKKVGEDEVVSAINVSSEEIELKGNRVIIESDNFKLSKEGNIEMLSGEIKISGTVTKYASDYTQADADRANEITIGLVNPTIEDFEKLDLNGDGVIDVFDAIIIGRLINGTDKQRTIDTSIEISPLTSHCILKTQGVSIGANGMYSKKINAEDAYFKDVHVMRQGGGFTNGVSGSFTSADGKTVMVTNGIITSIS